MKKDPDAENRMRNQRGKHVHESRREEGVVVHEVHSKAPRRLLAGVVVGVRAGRRTSLCLSREQDGVMTGAGAEKGRLADI